MLSRLAGYIYLASNCEFLALFREQVANVFEVELDIRAGDEVREVGRGGRLNVLKDVVEGARNHARIALAALHRVCLAGTGLAIREDAPVEPVQHGRDQRTHLHR